MLEEFQEGLFYCASSQVQKSKEIQIFLPRTWAHFKSTI